MLPKWVKKIKLQGNDMTDIVISSSGSRGDAASLLKQFRITDEDLKLVRKFGKKIQPNLASFVDEFYVWLNEQPFKADFFIDERQITKVRELQIDYWRTFFEANIDDAFVESRRYIGSVHARIELPLDIYMS